MVTTSPQVERQ